MSVCERKVGGCVQAEAELDCNEDEDVNYVSAEGGLAGFGDMGVGEVAYIRREAMMKIMSSTAQTGYVSRSLGR